MTPPKKKKQVCAFIGLVNYYRYMWAMRSYLLQPLTVLTSDQVKFKWIDVEHKAFDEIKRVVTRKTLLAIPHFNDHFDIYMNARNYQIRAVIILVDKAINLYSCKHKGP